jgi:hypothetical protein
MSPEERKSEMLKRDGYNFWQSSLRIAIECGFGMLIRRFGIFWRTMTSTLEHTQLIILACMSLHNVCIDAREADDANNFDAMRIRYNDPNGFRGGSRTWRDDNGRTQVEGRPITHLQDDCTTRKQQGRRSDLHNSTLRDELKERLFNENMPRPPHSRWGMTTARKKRRDMMDGRQPLV